MSDYLSQFLEGFALPDAGYDESFGEELAITHARATVQRVVQHHYDAFTALGTAVPEAVRLAASGPLSLDDVWCLPIGAAWSNLRSDPRYPAEQIVPLLVDWATWQLAARGLNNETCHVAPLSNQGSAGLHIVRGHYRVHLRYREDLCFDYEKPLREEALSSAEHASVEVGMHEAFDLIDRFAPEFGRWTLRLLREVIPIESGTPGCMRSGSSAAEPGRCHMSFPTSPVALAEMLIHETTHQYYYLVTRLGPVDDGTDTTLYYSPVKGYDRPIYYILIAYHAFANVLLFSQRCLAAGYNDPDGHLHRNVRILTEWLETLDKPLRNTTALTTVGRALWLPLARRLRDASQPSLDPLRKV